MISSLDFSHSPSRVLGTPGTPGSPGTPSKKQHAAFLTHDWCVDELGRENHVRVSKVNDLLKARGLETWFDSDRMRGDIVRQMTAGIDDAATVVVFITGRYVTKVSGSGPNGDDDNCKAEFDYACRRVGVGKMIAVLMEPSLRDVSLWHGAVGMKLGGKLYDGRRPRRRHGRAGKRDHEQRWRPATTFRRGSRGRDRTPGEPGEAAR